MLGLTELNLSDASNIQYFGKLLRENNKKPFTIQRVQIAVGHPFTPDQIAGLNTYASKGIFPIFTNPVFSIFCKINGLDYYLRQINFRGTNGANFLTDYSSYIVKLASDLSEIKTPQIISLSNLYDILKSNNKMPFTVTQAFYGKLDDATKKN